MLSDTRIADRSVGTIAFKVGFGSVTTFNRLQETLWREARSGKRTVRLAVAGTVRAFDDAHQVRHDAVELEILWRVDGGDAGLFQRGGIRGRDDAAHHQRHLDAGPLHAVGDVMHQRYMAA